MVSRSGDTASPKKRSSSPVLTMIVSVDGSATRSRPRRNFAAPTPPASTVNVGRFAIRPFSRTVELAVQGGALDGPASHGFDQAPDLGDRRVFAGIGTRLARDALFHQGAAEVVHSRQQR